MSKRITIKRIASEANVSIGTVDRVIHNRGEVAKKTRKKVLKIIKDLNYNVNIHARNLVLNKEYKIIALLPECQEEDYWFQPLSGILKGKMEFALLGIKVEIFDFDIHNKSSFKQKAREILEMEPDGIILAPALYDESLAFLRALNKKQVPVILVDANTTEFAPLSFIGQDPHQSGYLAGKLINTLNPGRLPVYCLSIIHDRDADHNNQLRINGLHAYFNTYLPGEPKVHDITINCDYPDIARELKKIYMANPDGANIFVSNSKVDMVARFIRESGMESKWNLIGYDLTPTNIEYLKNDYIDVLIHQNAEHQGFLAVESFYKNLVLKQKIVENQIMPIEIIMKENVDFIVKLK